MALLTTSFQKYNAWGQNYNNYSVSSMYLKKSSDDKTIYWYGRYDGDDALINNASESKYYYIGIK